jgi:rare lipoprotein A
MVMSDRRRVAMSAVAAVVALLSARPAEARTAVVYGLASWYGWQEHGKKMANGRIFRALGTSAASRTLPFGTRLRVTNPRNRRVAYVTIEDRGPVPKSRMIDLSLGTARELGLEKDGVGRVGIERIGSPIMPQHRRRR